MINLPYQLVPALHSALHEAIQCAAKEGRHAGTARRGGSNKSKKIKTMSEQTTKFFQNFEDEFLEQEAEVTTRRKCVDKSSNTTVGMLLEHEKHEAALTNISAMINA
ncbi:hypothetical protein PsorP6_014056 [Peronosclerospora sorghi]|uniref:Uncharacterized protein n=1 Tax=Peronosclerospora sorghi TaxID=230839 RepID=A0ACC0VIH5_9STRA|nr:hypothetical protein PsorP6_014056 [Peronosclerospora sorghi]